jgi:hypothetical protein
MFVAWPVAAGAFEPLTEEELDRTVASGLEALAASETAFRQEDASEVTEDAGDELSDSTQEEITLVAYRQALPIVMSRMTNSNRGPLGRHGSYSLSPVSATRSQKSPVSAPILRLGPFPRPNLPLFLGR